MIVLQLILFCALFTLMVKLAVRGDALNALYFYPKPVQERVYQLGLTDRETVARKRKRFMIPFLLVLLAALLLIIGLWNGIHDFWPAYFQALLFLETMNWFDGSDLIFPDMLTVTGKIEQYIKDHFHGRIDGAIGSSLGSSFVGQLIQRQRVHLDHGIFGSPDLDQSGRFSAWLQSKLVVPLLTSFTRGEKKKAKTREKLKSLFEMSDRTADQFMACFEKFSPESIKNEYYTDLLTWLQDDIHVEHTKVHFIYANRMGEKYLARYRKYFRDPEIREFDMQHEQWLLGEEKYTLPVLQAIDEFMQTPV